MPLATARYTATCDQVWKGGDRKHETYLTVPAGQAGPTQGGAMLRRITVTAAAAVLIPTAAPAVHARPEGPCRGYEWQTSTMQTRRLIRCVWDRFHVGHGGPLKAIRVGSCESGLRWWAVNWPFGGLFQHHLSYWAGRFSRFILHNRLRRRWHLSDSPFNARTQAIVTGLMVRAGGWGPWACA